MWASTIGVLLPASVPIPTRPPIVGWLRLYLAIVGTLLGMALVTGLWVLTPVRALLSTAALGIGLAAAVIAFKALARGQRWALWFAGATLVVTLAWGLWQLVAPAQPNTVVINLLSIFAAVVLIGVYRSRTPLGAFVAASSRVSLPVSAALVLSLLAPMLIPNALAGLPDPTQAAASDLTLSLSMRCDHGSAASGSTAASVQRVTLVADMTWRRGDLLPGGLAGLLRPPTEYGDTAGFRIVGDASAGAAIPSWLLPTDAVWIVDLETGGTAGWFGAGSPSTTQIPDTIGSFTIGVEQSAIRAGHTIRATWLLTPTSDSAAWPRIEVAYAHLDRFLLIGTVGCGETTIGRPVLAAPGPM